MVANSTTAVAIPRSPKRERSASISTTRLSKGGLRESAASEPFVHRSCPAGTEIVGPPRRLQRTWYSYAVQSWLVIPRRGKATFWVVFPASTSARLKVTAFVYGGRSG